MAFSRALATPSFSKDDLTSRMVGIGMLFGARAAKDPNIEDTIFAASIEAMDHDDLRVLSLLVAWFDLHSARVNADRLTKLVEPNSSVRVRALWTALAQAKATDRRFARLTKLHTGARIDLLEVGADFQIRRHGEDARFADTCLRVPANVLRTRPADNLSPSQLAKKHPTYRYRVLMGPSYRADCWAALVADQTLSAADLARKTYASFATAWQVKRDFAIVGDL